MDTQNTPVHAKLWHSAFWMIALACFCLTSAVYMRLSLIPIVLVQKGFLAWQIAAVVVAYGIGLYALGAKCSFWVQTYRRNLVCIRGVVGTMSVLGVMWFLENNNLNIPQQSFFILFVCLSFLLGAFFGLSLMVIASTLVIDVCESFRRTEANYVSGWFTRFALPLGPLFALLVIRYERQNWGGLVPMALAFVALSLMSIVRFPFKAPEDHVPSLSLDRFFLPRGIVLFCNQALILLSIGLLLVGNFTPLFFAMLFAGCLLAVVSARFVFLNADLKSEIVTGHLLIVMALALMLLNHDDKALSYIEPALLGLGVGIVGARFQLFFIKLSNHCQRGTSQSSFFLSWETGLVAGVALGCFMLPHGKELLEEFAVAVAGISLLIYQFYTHTWYLKNKNR